MLTVIETRFMEVAIRELPKLTAQMERLNKNLEKIISSRKSADADNNEA